MSDIFHNILPSRTVVIEPVFQYLPEIVGQQNMAETASGELRSKIPAVYNFSTPPRCHPYTSYGRISITSCLLVCRQLKRENAGVVRLFNLPGSIVIENNYSSAGHPMIVCDPSMDLEKIKADKKGMAVIKYRGANNCFNPHSKLGGMVPVQLKEFFKSDSDCRFGEIPVRDIPQMITEQEKKSKK